MLVMIGARISWFYVKPSPLIPQDDWNEITHCNKPLRRQALPKPHPDPHPTRAPYSAWLAWQHPCPSDIETLKDFQGSMMSNDVNANRNLWFWPQAVDPSELEQSTGSPSWEITWFTWSTLGFQVRNFEFTPSFSASHVDPLRFRANL